MVGPHPHFNPISKEAALSGAAKFPGKVILSWILKILVYFDFDFWLDIISAINIMLVRLSSISTSPVFVQTL